MTDWPSEGGAIRLQNVVTGEIRRVLFGSVEHNALRAERHPARWHEHLWEQLVRPEAA